jgi:hypothetical protein
MILLRLLSAGKTLVGVGRETGGYRLPEGEGLPRFGGKKNPFKSRACPRTERGQERGEQALAAGSAPVPTWPKTAPAAAGSKPEPIKQEAGVVNRDAQARREQPARRQGGQNLAQRILRGARDLFRRIPRSGADQHIGNTRPAQGELRLETVRVVRNDLCESDIEIVPRKPAPISARPGANGQDQSAGTADSAWGRVSARIFGPGDAQ